MSSHYSSYAQVFASITKEATFLLTTLYMSAISVVLRDRQVLKSFFRLTASITVGVYKQVLWMQP